MKNIIFASNNEHKLIEVKNILGCDYKINSPSEMGILDFEVDEDRDTLKGNALKKARTLYAMVNNPVFADDTGLFVDALKGELGVRTARYAGENASYEENNNKLLLSLKGLSKEKRRARYITVIAYIDKLGNEHFFEGKIEGEILSEKKGNNGFGYDPIFYVSEYNMSMAEMDESLKNKISHRANAVRNLKEYLDKIK